MTSTELRDKNFDSLRGQLEHRLAAVYLAWLNHGPGTTRAVAEAAGMDLLSLRPRTTDLCHLGLLEMVGTERGNGIYRARTAEQWREWREAIALPLEGQLSLAV
jgi:hypothetical protein